MKIRKQGTNGKQKWTRLDKNEDKREGMKMKKRRRKGKWESVIRKA